MINSRYTPTREVKRVLHKSYIAPLLCSQAHCLSAAREGRLLLMPKEHKQPKREDVLNSVRAYVSEIECFARRGWEGLILKQYLEECSS